MHTLSKPYVYPTVKIFPQVFFRTVIITVTPLLLTDRKRDFYEKQVGRRREGDVEPEFRSFTGLVRSTRKANGRICAVLVTLKTCIATLNRVV